MPIESSLQEIQRYLVTNPGEEEMQLLPPVWIMKNLDKNDQNGQGWALGYWSFHYNASDLTGVLYSLPPWLPVLLGSGFFFVWHSFVR